MSQIKIFTPGVCTLVGVSFLEILQGLLHVTEDVIETQTVTKHQQSEVLIQNMCVWCRKNPEAVVQMRRK